MLTTATEINLAKARNFKVTSGKFEVNRIYSPYSKLRVDVQYNCNIVF